MTCHGNNATPPSPAIAPGVESIDPAAFARELAARTPAGDGVDPRVAAILPGFDAPFFQAGLAGYSDGAMRIVARRHGAPLCVTEALLDRMLLGGGRGFHKADLTFQNDQLLHENLPSGSEDHPLVGQIIGGDPDEMAAAAVKMIEQGRRHNKAYRDMAYGHDHKPVYIDTRWTVCDEEVLVPDGPAPAPATSRLVNKARAGPQSDSAAGAHRSFAMIDVNLACPVKKIDRKHRGGHWLTDPAGAKDILKAVREAVPRDTPVSVKLRRAYDDTPEMAANFERIFEAAYELGYAWATVHARTVEQKYMGPSRWTFLKDLAWRNRDKPIFGSGDVWEAPDIFRMIAYTGVSGVSVARGCIGNPWIFRQARDMLAGQAPRTPSLVEQREVLRQHFALSVALNGETPAGKMMRKFGIKFAQHHPQPERVKAAMVNVNSTADWLTALDALYPLDAAPVGGGHND